MIDSVSFPRLSPKNCRITSPPTAEYNCIAWAAKDETRWCEPNRYWPIETDPVDYDLGILVRVFESLGFAECSDGLFEPEFLKIAIYGSGVYCTHAARQLPTGKWTSKLGKREDIEHDQPDDVGGGVYGELVLFMKRAFAPESIGTGF